MKQDSIQERIQAFNQGRDPDRLKLKYAALQQDCFSFLRGTAHLFYQDWPQDTALNQAPLTWVCGDLHFENFGSYQGDNRLCYFDINDFDEAVLAPCTWDLARFLCSVLVGAHTLQIEQKRAEQLCERFIATYAAELRQGKARWIERATATGMIRDLLKSLKQRSHAELIHERTRKQDGHRVLNIDGKKTLWASNDDQQKVRALIKAFASTQTDPTFFQVLDVARRIAGTGSLGLERYVILINGKGRKHHYLLDMKYQPGSSLAPYLTHQQPHWNSEAERVVQLQRLSQAIAPAFLSVITDGKRSYLLKELMPTQDRLHLAHWQGKFSRLEKVVTEMAELVAWQHIRSGGWHGSAINDQWQAFGHGTDWQGPLLDYALAYSQQIRADWLKFNNGDD